MQKYYCKNCNKYQRENYCYRLTAPADDLNIKKLNNEGMGISSMSRYLKIAKTTVRRRILIISNKLKQKEILEMNQVYEVDEMQTFIGRNHPSCYAYITYAINRAIGKVIDFIVGRRSKEMIGKVIQKLLSLSPKRIYTDGLQVCHRPACSPSHSFCGARPAGR